MIRTNISLEDDVYKKLKQYSFDNHLSLSGVIRRALADYFLGKDLEEVLTRPEEETSKAEPTIEELRQIQKEAEERYAKQKVIEETREPIE